MFLDLAVGAPYEDNGAVYVFLGGPNGLATEPSQKLVSPHFEGTQTQPMFGHGLSKGSDIDGNHYLGKPFGNLKLVALYTLIIYRSGRRGTQCRFGVRLSCLSGW